MLVAVLVATVAAAAAAPPPMPPPPPLPAVPVAAPLPTDDAAAAAAAADALLCAPPDACAGTLLGWLADVAAPAADGGDLIYLRHSLWFLYSSSVVGGRLRMRRNVSRMRIVLAVSLAVRFHTLSRSSCTGECE